MASEILGLFTSPEQYQRQQDLMMQRQAAELAQLDPYQSIRFNAIRAGQQFGRGLAGILGAEDPQLRMITARQSALQGINLNDPESIFTAARQLADAGDQQGALTLADYGRKAASEAALAQQRSRAERAAATPKELQLSQARAKAKGLTEGTPEYNKFIDEDLVRQTTKEVKPDLTTEIKNASAVAKSEGLKEGTPEFNKRVGQLVTQYTNKADARFGVDREAIAEAEFEKPFAQLTKEQKVYVNKLVDEEKRRQAEKNAPKFVMPGQTEAIDIPKLRKTLMETLDRYKSTIDAGDSAISLLTQAKESNNPSSFNAGITELAKMTQGGSRLSNQDVELARRDPAVLRTAADMISTAALGRPTKYTIDDILKTVKTLREVAAVKYTRELNTQKKIAAKAKIDQETINILFEDTTLPPAALSTDGKPAGGKVRKKYSELP